MAESNYSYHSDMTHFGSTMLKVYRKSPRRFKALYIDKTMQPDEPTPEMILGSITHLLVSGFPLESEFLVAKGCSSRRGKEWEQCNIAANAENLTPILPDQLELARSMADQVLKDSIAGKFWKAEGPIEVPIRWKNNGIPLKCKPDKLVIDPRYDWTLCVSLKTSTKAELPGFLWAIRDYDYDMSEAMYVDGIKAANKNDGGEPQTLMVVVSKESPYDVYVYHVAPERNTMVEGRIKYDDTLKSLANSIKNNDWLNQGQKRIQVI